MQSPWRGRTRGNSQPRETVRPSATLEEPLAECWRNHAMLIPKATAPSLTGGKLASMLRSPTSPPSPTAANDQIPLQNGSAIYNEGRTQSETAIDPLSQVGTDLAICPRQT
jgi:hypothetical protein